MTRPSDSDCADDCVLARRLFLRDMTLLTAGLVAAGLAPRDAAAMPATVRALLRAGNDVRYPIPAKDGVEIDKTNEVILVRYQGKVYAFALSCPHQNTALSVAPSGVGFQCSKHHSKYQPDGTFIEGRATRNMDRLVIRRDGNAVVVDVATWFESDSEPTKWAGAVVTL